MAGDLLGDVGRRAIESCFKVQICDLDEGKESLTFYDRAKALEKIGACYEGGLPQGFNSSSFFDPLAQCDFCEGHKSTNNIITIRETLFYYDQISYVVKYPEESDDPACKELKELIDKRRADVQKELTEAEHNDTQREYSWIVAQRRVRDCFSGNFAGDRGLLEPKPRGEMYTITEIYDAFQDIEKRGDLLTYPKDEGPGSEELKTLIDRNREKLKEEKEAKRNREFSRNQAERQVRDCFAGTFSGDTDIFPEQKNTYNIFEIQAAIDNFDEKKLMKKYPEEETLDHEKKKMVEDARKSIQDEYEVAISETERSHGSGFIMENGYILTGKHVLEDYFPVKETKRIYISNEATDGLCVPCEIVNSDPFYDLASLKCLPLFQKKILEISPLQLSNEKLKTGQEVLCFGYPIHHTGMAAFVVRGIVSGVPGKRYARPPLISLDCSLSAGNSGGPVLRWEDNKLKVFGVVKEQAIKHFLPSDQICKMVEDSSTTVAVSDVPNEATGIAQTLIDVKELVTKIYLAMTGTHSSFKSGNALPAHFVSEFVRREKVDQDSSGGIRDSTK